MYSTVIRHPFNYVMPGATSKRNMKYRLSSDGISYVRSSLKADVGLRFCPLCVRSGRCYKWQGLKHQNFYLTAPQSPQILLRSAPYRQKNALRG